MSFGKSYPIWHQVETRNYKTNKSFGGNHSGTQQTICVGSSASNSHELASIEVKSGVVDEHGNQTFSLLIDGQVAKQLTVEREGARVEVPFDSDLTPVPENVIVHKGYEQETTLTIGRLMKRLAQLVLGGRGNERIVVDLPKESCDPTGNRRRFIVLEGKDKFVLQLQG